MRHTSAVLAARPLARSMLVSRSTRLSPGGIAGAVVGSVVGALLLAFCLFPFVVRARRRRRDRHDDPGLAEMGQGPGGPILVPSSPLHDVDGSSYKAGSGSGPDTGPGSHDHPATAATPTDLEAKSSLPQGVVVQHGLPSPVSSPPSPTDRPSRDDGQEAAAATTATATTTPSPTRSPTRSPTEAPSLPRHESTRTVDRESTRGLSFTDSYGPPSGELTNITTVGITEEPESFDRPSGSPDSSGPFPHLRESLRTLFHGRRSSSQQQQQQQQQQEQDSRRGTFADSSGSRWQPAPTNEAFLPQQEPVPSGLEIDTETPGLAWDYYHDPNLDIELADAYTQGGPTTLPEGHPLADQLPPTTLGAEFPITYSQPGPATFPAGALPPTQLPTSVPLGFGFPTGQFPLPQAGFPPAAIPRPIPDHDAISPNSDATVTPGAFGGQNILFQGKKFPGAPQRTDSLPLPTITSDLPSPPLCQYTAGPSGNPMEMMKPTNQAESAWMLEHMIHNSPPAPPLLDTTMSMQMTTPSPGPAFSPEVFTKPEPPSPYQQQSLFHTPYQSPPLAATDPVPQFNDLVEFYSGQLGVVVPDQVAPSDYSTPPPSTGPSTENTPDTRLTPFTSSPSPAADMVTMNGHLAASPSVPAGLSPSSGLSVSPAASRPTSPAPSAGRSPGRSPARPPGGFECKVCGTVKESLHQFKYVTPLPAFLYPRQTNQQPQVTTAATTTASSPAPNPAADAASARSRTCRATSTTGTSRRASTTARCRVASIREPWGRTSPARITASAT